MATNHFRLSPFGMADALLRVGPAIVFVASEFATVIGRLTAELPTRAWLELSHVPATSPI